MNKNSFFYLILLVLISFIVFFFLRGDFGGRGGTVSYEFHGTIERIEGGTIFATGNFIDSNGKPISYSNRNDNGLIEVQIKLDSRTSILRTALVWPSSENLGEDGWFDPEALERQDSVSSLDILINDYSQSAIGFFAKTNKNISGKDKFTITELSYRTVIRDI